MTQPADQAREPRRVLAGALISLALVALGMIGYLSASGQAAPTGYYGYCGPGYGYEYCPPPPPPPAHLVVIKHVVTDDGGSAVAADFTMRINGVVAQGGNIFPGEEAPGTDKVVTTGNYDVTETGPPGYAATFSADCTGSISAGQTKTCTVTNNDQAAHLIVIKHVINDNDGNSSASDFTMTIDGVIADGGNTFPGAESPGTDKEVTPGNYNVSETGPPGYVAFYSADCTGSISLGQTKTCTVTNNDIAPRRTMGYWRNHQAETTALLPQTLGMYSVATFAQAAAVFDVASCSSSKPSAAVACLAAQLLAAKLNLANASDPCITPTVTNANRFLSGLTVTVGGITVTGIVYTGPGVTYTLTSDQRQVALLLKDALDKYNGGSRRCVNP